MLKKGDLGGLVLGEHNLSQEGNCWVYNNAIIYGNARVFGNAIIYDNAEVFGNAIVFDNAEVFGNTVIFGNAEVFGNIEVSNKDYILQKKIGMQKHFQNNPISKKED